MITCFYDVNIHLKGNYSCNNTVLEYSTCCCLFSCFFFTPCCVLWSTAPGVYAVVRCENDTVRSRVFKAEGNPEFNLRAIFYRRYPNTHISIEVWHIHPVCPLNMIHTHTQYAHTISPHLCLVCSCGAEVCCGTRCSAGLDSRRRSPRGVGASWWICEAAHPVQDPEGASTWRRPPASASQTCDTTTCPLRWRLMD